jgi:hypothetical protein
MPFTKSSFTKTLPAVYPKPWHFAKHHLAKHHLAKLHSAKLCGFDPEYICIITDDTPWKEQFCQACLMSKPRKHGKSMTR